MRENKTRQFLHINKKTQITPQNTTHTHNPTHTTEQNTVLRREGKERRDKNHNLSVPSTLFRSTLARAHPGKWANTFCDTGAHHLGPWRQKYNGERLHFYVDCFLKLFTSQ